MHPQWLLICHRQTTMQVLEIYSLPLLICQNHSSFRLSTTGTNKSNFFFPMHNKYQGNCSHTHINVVAKNFR